jgi:hypothetical protein
MAKLRAALPAGRAGRVGLAYRGSPQLDFLVSDARAAAGEAAGSPLTPMGGRTTLACGPPSRGEWFLLLKRCGIIIGVVTIGVLALAQGAMADPVNAKNSLVFPAICDNGQSYQISVNGNGEFTPGHVVGSTSMLIPEAFNLTFEFTPTGGEPESETDTAAKHNVHGNTTTCTIDFTQTFPEGSFHLFGTATGFITPAS